MDQDWPKKNCSTLQIKYCGSNRVSPGGPNVSLTSPLTTKSILGDGNCLFRTLSYIITGSEKQHMLIRQAIVQHMRSISALLWGSHISNIRYPSGIEQYIADNHIERDGSWGSDVEMLTLAHLLNVAVISYSRAGKQWAKYSPCNVDHSLESSQHDGMSMYIRHTGDHFDVVTSVKRSMCDAVATIPPNSTDSIIDATIIPTIEAALPLSEEMYPVLTA